MLLWLATIKLAIACAAFVCIFVLRQQIGSVTAKQTLQLGFFSLINSNGETNYVGQVENASTTQA